MQNKSTKEIQNEIEFMRRAYADRERRLDYLNHYLADRHPVARPLTILGSLALVAAAIAFTIRFIKFILS